MSITADIDPIARFNEWYADAEVSEPVNPNAVTLATATPGGVPSARMVLLKGVDERGFVFYTNLTSRKGDELASNPMAALCFYWKSLARQVRVEGPVSPVAEAEADAYFASRDRMARIGAWASKQSQVLEGRFQLEARVAKYTAKFNIGDVPRPEFWSGFRVTPERVEFWEELKFRLHERTLYSRSDGSWQAENLYP